MNPYRTHKPRLTLDMAPQTPWWHILRRLRFKVKLKRIINNQYTFDGGPW